MAARNHAAQLRDVTAVERDAVAVGLDDKATTLDELAVLRDEVGDQRDARGEQRDARAGLRLVRTHDDVSTSWSEEIRSMLSTLSAELAEERRFAELDRAAAAKDREYAGFDRTSAMADRLVALRCRRNSGGDRGESGLDRQESASDRHHAAFDSLSGAYTREAGLIELDREVLRARASDGKLAVTYIDIAGLDLVDEPGDYAVLDQNLAAIIAFLRPYLEPYDVIVRMSGNQLLCVLTGHDLVSAANRFDRLTADLGAVIATPASVTTGFSVLQPDDSPSQLVKRAYASVIAEHTKVHRLPPRD